MLVYLQVLRKKPDFRRKPWPSISNSAKDFVKKLLVKDPRARLTAAQALCMFLVWVYKERNITSSTFFQLLDGLKYTLYMG